MAMPLLEFAGFALTDCLTPTGLIILGAAYEYSEQERISRAPATRREKSVLPEIADKKISISARVQPPSLKQITPYHSPKTIWTSAGKRAFDIFGSLILILILMPLLALVSLAVFLERRGKIIFAHGRVGKGGENFPCLKFTTMAANSEDLLKDLLARDPVAAREWRLKQKLTHDPRVTRLGHFLRKTSIDELPQLFNVLRGEMSLIGPRPIVRAEAVRYGRYFAHYCSVKPGLTGLWQVSGRNDTTYERRVAIDAYYSRHASFKLDLFIMSKTLPAIMFGKGCS